MLRWTQILTLVLLVIHSCVLPYELEEFNLDRVVVVSGTITDELKYHEVNLSYTYPIESNTQEELSNATVWVEDGHGIIYSFKESSPGQYLAISPFAAKQDRSYQLFFTTADGKHYQSTMSKPLASPPIDMIYNKYVEIIPKDGSSKEGGIQFFLDSYDKTETAKYFRYEWEETYKIITPFISEFRYDTTLQEPIRRDTAISICYSEDKSSSLIIGTSAGSIENKIKEFPIRYVSGETDVLRNRYSILVKQYAIDNSTYGFYKKLNESESRGSLFDQQQGTIIGNITSTTNPTETVLGYFEVSGVSSLRVFFNFADLDKSLIYPHYRYRCSNDDIIGTTPDSIGYYLEQSNSLRIINVKDSSIPPATLAPRNCTDCSWFAPTTKPEYWID